MNVAARLQTLAEPGGICVSRAVREQVLDKLSFSFEDLGAQHVKNITRAVEVYRINFGSGSAEQHGELWQRLRLTLGKPVLALGGLAVAIAALALWTLPQMWKAPIPPAPARLSVAVLSFASPGGGPPEAQFADSLTQNLVQGLGRGRTLSVVSSSATEKYRGKPTDPGSVGRELNVRYLASGEVRRVGKQLVINAQLIDAGTATQLWSDRLEVTEEGSELANSVARLTRRMGEVLVGAEVARADKPPQASAPAIDFYLYAHDFWARNPTSVKGAAGAIKIFDQALERDPNLVSAMVSKCIALYYLIFLGPPTDHDRLVKEMDDLSLRAATIDERNPSVWLVRATALAFQWRWDAALEANAQAQRLDASDSGVLSQRAEIMLLTGRPTEALALADKALALESANTVATAWPLHTRCRTYVGLGRYAEAIPACEKSAFLHEWWMPHLYLVAAYQHLGNAARAAAEKAIALQQRPSISIADFKALRLSDNAWFLEQSDIRLFAELRTAGIPDQ